MLSFNAPYFPKPLICRILLWLCILSGVLFASCNNHNNYDFGYSKAFKPVFDSTNRLFELHRIDEAIHYVDSSTRRMPDLTVADKFRFYAFHYVANNRYKRNNQTALLYADSMRAVIEQSDDKEHYSTFYAEANFARGDALFELDRYAEAYNNYYQGYLIGKNNFNNCTLSDYTYRMGMITYKQGNYKLAAQYFRQSFAQKSTCTTDFPSFYRQQEVLDNAGLSYRNGGQLDSALIYFDKALQYINEHEPAYRKRYGSMDVAKAVVYGNKAEVLSLQGKNAEAMDLLQKSIAINMRKGNDNHDAELSEVKLGQLYVAQKDNKHLAILLDKLQHQLDSSRSADVELGWHWLMGQYYKGQNNGAAALPHIEQYHKMRDSTADHTRTLKASSVSDQMADLQKQYEIVALQNKQRVYFYATVIFVCMSSIIILLIYRNWRRSNNENIMVTGLNQQINERKVELEETLTELKVSSQEKDRILRTVAHDLRNPLGGIASLTSAMIEDTDYNNEQIELLKIIKETAYDSLELINEILEATNTSPAELHKQLVDINALLNNSVELMRFKAAEKNQKIMLHTLDAPEELLISREKIWRVISNLISNAIKFSPVGAVIEVNIVREGDDVRISVNDHGIGIPEQDKAKVFNMFTDAKRPGTLGEKSFGLGLSICRQIIERHHGKIWFESNTQDGTTFFIQLSKSGEAVPVA